MKRPKLTVLSLTCMLLYLLFLKHHYDHRAHKLPPHPRPGGHNFHYSVMFDAGSTGTRVHVFKFQSSHQGAAVPHLEHETYRAIKPGLSAYAGEPLKCVPGIEQLLEVAKLSVPSSQWNVTPVALKATAGLRLLPGDKAARLLDTVRTLFQVSPFLSKSDCVSMMDGTDEGISAWITVNFLTGGLQRQGSPTVGMLDLGGGSTQIAFCPQDEKTIQSSPVDFITSLQMFNQTHNLYTHSYLGLGLMSARLSILGGVEAPPLGGSVQLVSPCLAPEYSGVWQHNDVIYAVRGQRSGGSMLAACRSRVEKLLYRKVEKVMAVEDMDFYAFSYYYDRAVDLGAIEAPSAGVVTVAQYSHAAERVCADSYPGPLNRGPFLCLDLLYISVLLQELGFPPHKQLKVTTWTTIREESRHDLNECLVLQLARTINHMETSWALGATVHYLQYLRSN
ncbi:ectonucleoside triphosphate diphosphohydrolase 6 isoform X2 [Synchiropus splendidus]|uniref:ectonucleoside triphosphate diphosphohydrolase 6 isoform X2 n=1 Tax=Synchiropus splendidus TaxID=270530 RepID=UPI00237E84A1|nr:ectonucleoside triphosphate diphosphohydrolase 6 isoform X2 [Synchiropus splendidus]